LRCARPKAYQYFGLYDTEFGIQPWTTGFDFGVVGLLVNASLSALGGHPFEMLYNVGDVDVGSVDTASMRA